MSMCVGGNGLWILRTSLIGRSRVALKFTVSLMSRVPVLLMWLQVF